jgi:hypothetical protein
MSNSEDEIVTLKLGRKAAGTLSLALWILYRHGINHYEQRKIGMYRDDKRIREAYRALDKLKDRRRKSTSLSFEQ